MATNLTVCTNSQTIFCMKKSVVLMKVFAILLLLSVLGSALAICWPTGDRGSRDLGCTKLADLREREICQSISGNLRWTWTGHAIISTGWRPTWDTIHDVYCSQKITENDIPVLEALKHASNVRLEQAAQYLLYLAINRDGKRHSAGEGLGTIDEVFGGIFNPRNPSYILQDGCRRKSIL